ncbi:hypothetical protein E4V01_21820 [Methylorubrum sp. Q1]|nr:hypothetical protein E4V01_21820 [Methylorubrum sp. Q1]
MERELPPWLEFDFGDKIGNRIFKDRNEALEFVQKEFDFYQWMSNYQNESAFSTIAQFVFNSTNHSVYGLNNQHQCGDGVIFFSKSVFLTVRKWGAASEF